MKTATSIYAIEHRLNATGLELPSHKPSVANYLGCKQSGDLLYVSGQIGDIRGVVGAGITKQEGQHCAQQALLHMLRTVKEEIGSLDRIASIDKLLGFVRSAADFTEQPAAIDGASNLLVDLFGVAGLHSKTAMGVTQTPFGAAVQLEMTVRLKRE